MIIIQCTFINILFYVTSLSGVGTGEAMKPLWISSATPSSNGAGHGTSAGGATSTSNCKVKHAVYNISCTTFLVMKLSY